MHSAYKKNQDIQKNVRDILTFFAMQEDTREERHRFWHDRARQLLQSYRTMKQKATAAKSPLPAAILVLDASLQRGQNQFDIDWILQSSARCSSVCRYMETMMESYQNMVACRSEEEKRCWRLLQSRHFSPFEKSRTSLCEQEHISKSTFYRYEARAVKHLSVFLFGVVAGL